MAERNLWEEVGSTGSPSKTIEDAVIATGVSVMAIAFGFLVPGSGRSTKAMSDSSFKGGKGGNKGTWK